MEKEDRFVWVVAAGIVGVLAPFAVLLVSGSAELALRAAYALCLGGVMAACGTWIAFRATREQLARRFDLGRHPAWSWLFRGIGAFVVVAAGVLLNDTVRDVVDLAAGRPRTFVEKAGNVDGHFFLHPVFQTVWLRGDESFRHSYMFVYGGKRLIPGRAYTLTVLPRSHWILSAQEVYEVAGP